MEVTELSRIRRRRWFGLQKRQDRPMNQFAAACCTSTSPLAARHPCSEVQEADRTPPQPEDLFFCQIPTGAGERSDKLCFERSYSTVAMVTALLKNGQVSRVLNGPHLGVDQ